MNPVPPTPIPIPIPIEDINTGDWVVVLYWSPFPMPDNKDHGSWSTNTYRVVNVGRKNKKVVVEVPVTTAHHWAGDVHAERGSPLRFVDADRVFADAETAVRYSQTLTPPKAQ